MALEWLDKPDNPAMSEWGVTSEDVYGAVVVVNLHELLYKAALTGDFETCIPITELAALERLDWLDLAS